MIKAVIFDFDGTLSNRQENVYYLYKYCFKKYFSDLNDDEYEAILQDMMLYDCNGTINLKERMIQFRKKYPNRLTDEDVEEFNEYYSNNMYLYCHPKKETYDVINELKGKYKLGIISNGQPKIQHDKINHLNLPELFDEVIVSGDFGIDKPDKRIFDVMIQKLGVKAEECMFIGDVYSSDVLGALRANMVPVWITTDYEKPTSYTGFRISSLKELPGLLSTIK